MERGAVEAAMVAYWSDAATMDCGVFVCLFVRSPTRGVGLLLFSAQKSRMSVQRKREPEDSRSLYFVACCAPPGPIREEGWGDEGVKWMELTR
jgi:hypothetical protein